MSSHKYIVLGFLVLCIMVPLMASAASLGLMRPTGGRIIKSGPSAEIVCAATFGPLFIKPVNFAPAGPFFIRTGRMVPRSGGIILGNYNPIPDVGTCYNPETGVPIPAFEFRPYGASR